MKIFFPNLITALMLPILGFAQILNLNLIEPRFEHITQKDGLPENSVFAIEQDFLGYMWLGTQNGLVKYDGYSMKVYQSELSNDQNFDSKSINYIYEDRFQTLWIGTLNGLIRYTREKDSFSRYNNQPQVSNSINSNVITCIYDDARGNLWVGTDKGLNLFDRNKNRFNHYDFYEVGNSKALDRKSNEVMINAIIEYPSKGKLLLCIDHVGLYSFDISTNKFSKFKLCFTEKQIDNFYSFCLGRDSTLWIGCSAGVIKFDSDKNICKLFSELYHEVNDRMDNFVRVVESHNRLLYVSFANGGLAAFDPIMETFQRIIWEDNNPQGLRNNSVKTVYVDRSGILWVGMWSGGLSRYDSRRQKFNSLIADPYNPHSLSSNYVMSIIPEKPNEIWIITDKMIENGNVQTLKINHILPYENFSYEDYFVNSIIDNSGLIWIGTNENGIVKFNPTNNSYRYYFDEKSNSDITYNDRITSLHQDSDGSIWIGTLGQGLYKYYPDSGNYEVFRHDDNDTTSINNDEIITIYEDQNRTIWIGSNGGLNRYIPEKKSFRSLPNATARVLFEDSEKKFWLGTYMYGLSLLERNSEKIITTFTEKDGLSNNTICSIQEDDSGNLWIGTNNGLSKFNFEKRTFRNYYVQDGLNQDAFQINASAKGLDGTIYFGIHQSGLNYFEPDSIKDDPVPPQVVIENISLFNRPNEKLSYKGFIPELEMVELPYDQNDLHFEYVGLHFSEPIRNKYKYILEGFDDSWIDAGNLRTATYTNLDPGEYVFKVNAANRDGVWNEKGASIIIIINPPMWATTWAYLLYVVFALSLIYFLWKLNLRRIRVKHEYEMSKFEAEKLHEVDGLKSRFFANISHEFRTPLTLILGPAKDIIDSTKETKTKQTAGLIKRNAGRLLRLVNQLLDLSKLEAGRMKLETRKQDIIPLLKGLVLSFSSLADLKKIKLNLSTAQDGIDVYLDKDKIEKIVNNLLSNAFKFTPEGGKIEVTIEKMINDVEIRITDSGIGIPKENIEKIFDRFYQVDSSHTREQEGTGIGLALTKELVELHKVKIEVESETGKGTTFIVRIPLGKEHLKPEEIIEEKVREEILTPVIEAELVDEITTRKEKTDIDVLIETDKPLLLIVEDNSDVRKYIISHLEDNYRIQEAVDGVDGLEQAFNHIPDLIISDVMMPKMDGFEMCNKLKTDERTSHIPIIMLTAKATSQDKISGYETGADDYIMKPFDAAELKVRIKKLIEIRRKLQEKFRSADFAVPPGLSSIDEQFMKRVLNVVNEHISEEKFSINELGKEVGMSREHLYRKLKAITGHSASLFIRSVRLVKAKKLIKDRKGTISEISFSVGFSSPAYFGKCFKEEFGYSPGEL